ncbi:DUF1566 domain-containing protein [Leptospira sp. 201903070]|uniref:DUF1566 domain-containing protein n=1 Tax=Leptospira ainlahdjerensis TaxID=2810033 RepID=A0ABS2U9Q1_9LEPT|nr:DUF1566 domain-containing protein [Leptospira ainlahdjerensis]MBM9577095.1 DUF1566 domain-containing protein [Leptospira ainlahdjerensis]
MSIKNRLLLDRVYLSFTWHIILVLQFLFLNCLPAKNGNKGFTIFPLNIGQFFSANDSSTTNANLPAATGTLTYSSQNTVYVSGQTGAFEYVDVRWSSSQSADYEIRYSSTNCSDGTVDSQGSVSAETSTISRIHAIAGTIPLNIGSNSVRICLYNVGKTSLWDSYGLTVLRDDTAPIVSFTPAGGVYGTSAPNVTISCADVGNSNCNRISYRTDGNSASIGNDGSAPSGNVLFSSAIALANNTVTNFSAIAVDNAGNIGVANTASYTVAFGNPTITIVSLSKSVIRSVDNSTLTWKSDIAGNYSIQSNGTNCTDGTVLLTGSATANTNVSSAISGSTLNAGSNTIRVCFTTPGSNQGTTSTSVSRDDIAPKIITASPALTPNAAAFGLSVNQKTFSLTFDEDMDTSISPIPTHWDQTQGDKEIKWPGAIGSWSADKRTYTLNVQSNLPEWHKFYWRYSDTSFKDIAGNVVVSSPTVTISAGNINLNYGTIQDTAYFFPLDTEQSFCADQNGNTIPCNGTGQDGEVGGVIPVLSPNTFFSFPMNINGFANDFVTIDTKNNRFWRTCEPDYEMVIGLNLCVKICPGQNKWNGSSCVAEFENPMKTFNQAVESCSELNGRNNGTGYAGRKGWRVPTLAEYNTILEYDSGGFGNEAIPERFFPGLSRSNYHRFWTSSNSITINTTNIYTLTPNIDLLSNGPINYSAISSLQSWGAWSISVFDGISIPYNKLKNDGWDSGSYYYTTLCISD